MEKKRTAAAEAAAAAAAALISFFLSLFFLIILLFEIEERSAMTERARASNLHGHLLLCKNIPKILFFPPCNHGAYCVVLEVH